LPIKTALKEQHDSVPKIETFHVQNRRRKIPVRNIFRAWEQTKNPCNSCSSGRTVIREFQLSTHRKTGYHLIINPSKAARTTRINTVSKAFHDRLPDRRRPSWIFAFWINKLLNSVDRAWPNTPHLTLPLFDR